LANIQLWGEINCMQNELVGSCHCGMVKFKLKSQPKLVVSCHCDECKKRNGSAFSTYLAVAETDLEISNGANSLKQYAIENEGIKHFCADCGSPIFNKNYRFPGLYMVFYGAMSDAANFQPGYNVFCESKHAWVDSIDKIPSFERLIER